MRPFRESCFAWSIMQKVTVWRRSKDKEKDKRFEKKRTKRAWFVSMKMWSAKRALSKGKEQGKWEGRRKRMRKQRSAEGEMLLQADAETGNNGLGPNEWEGEGGGMNWWWSLRADRRLRGYYCRCQNVNAYAEECDQPRKLAEIFHRENSIDVENTQADIDYDVRIFEIKIKKNIKLSWE